MATLTLTATPLPTATPPAVRLDVTATGTPTVTSVTITRQDASGVVSTVRTSDGGPLPVSGGVATVFDPEIPYGQAATYTATAAGASDATATATLDVEDIWLVDVGVPARSVPVEFRIGTNDEETWDVDQGVFPILGRDTPIVVTGGSRQAPVSSLIVGTDTPAQSEAMRQLLSDGSTLLLNVPPLSGLGLSTAYISVGAVRYKRRSNIGTDPQRDIELPYRVVSRPAGGSQAAITWETIAAAYPTWDAIPAGTTWAELANPTT